MIEKGKMKEPQFPTAMCMILTNMKLEWGKSKSQKNPFQVIPFI